jgi:cytidylate kinase
MPVWTISAQKGVGANLIARELAERAGVALYDTSALVACAAEHGLDPIVGDDSTLALRVAGRLNDAAMGVGASLAVMGAMEEIGLRGALLRQWACLIAEAARGPAVILAASAFTALRDHPAAVHARICAPLDWRVEMYARRHLIDARMARRIVRADDRRQHGLARTVGVNIDDPANYCLVIDARRLGQERSVGTLLAAGAGGRASRPVPTHTIEHDLATTH